MTWVIFGAESCLAVAYLTLSNRGKVIKIKPKITLVMLKELKNTRMKKMTKEVSK